MSTTPPDPSPEAPTAVVRPPLRRPAEGRALAGVCAAVARRLGVDPVLVRIVTVVLALAAGAGALAYLAGALLIPSEDAPEGAPRTSSTLATVLGAGALALAALILVPIGAGLAGPVIGLGLVVALGLLTWMLAGGRPGHRPGQVLARAGLGLALLAGCGALALAAAWLAGTAGTAVAAGLVLAVGALLVGAAFVPRGRWLVLPALAIALPAAFVVAAGIDLRGGLGDERHAPRDLTAVAPSYELGMGHLVVDLRDVDFRGARREVDLRLGVGQATVVVPAGVCVSGRSQLGLGYTDMAGGRSGGVDVDLTDTSGPRPPYGALVLDTHVGMGAVELLTPRQADAAGVTRGPVRQLRRVTYRQAGTAACA